MIDRDHELNLTRQAELLELSRASLYYQPVPVTDADLALMRRIDERHLEYPFAGSRLLRDLLVGEGHAIGRRHVRTLMRKMGISAIYRRAHTSRRHPAHPVYPYLLRGLAIDRPNQVWAADITLYLLSPVASRYRHARRGRHGYYVRPRVWDVDVAPRLTFASLRDRTVMEAPPLRRA